jgi:hypothetical protein
MHQLPFWVLVICAIAVPAKGDDTPTEWNPRERFLKELVADVPGTLKKQDPTTGRFRFGDPWLCGDQNVIFALTVAWATEDSTNPFHHDQALLESVMKGGDALIAAQDKQGAWPFLKRDNSYWGQFANCWTYSRWVRAFQVIKGAMPAARREHWEAGLKLGLSQMARSLPTAVVQNIPCYHAMGLYGAGMCFDREDWKQIASNYLAKVIAAQSPDGYWTEHSGPVVGYNAVYVEALGAYYSMSHDAGVIEPLRRAAVFHRTFTYPDGSSVETVDERNPYHRGPASPNLGFSFTPEGRALLLQQMKFLNWTVGADSAADFILSGQTGPAGDRATDQEMIVVGKDDALVWRKSPWFICLSAYVCPQSTSRWIQDRQNLASIYHEKAGLILGGGNTKMQPLWSSFTVGDTAQLRHKPGDQKPDFLPKGDLIHVPSRSQLKADKLEPSLSLTYGTEECTLAVRPLDDHRLKVICQATGHSPKPVEGHLTFLPPARARVQNANGQVATLGNGSLSWSAADMGGWFQYGNVRVSVPTGAKLLWPVKRHNPYKKDGSSRLEDARLVLCLPISSAASKQEITLQVGAN